VPLAGEAVDGRTFDGRSEAAIFPGDLPADPQRLLSAATWPAPVAFVRFRPPLLSGTQPWPHIRLDRTLQFLLGDYLE
jgi:predicted YcjX-like family ATPase